MRAEQEEAKSEVTKKIRPTQKAPLHPVFCGNSRRHISKCGISICRCSVRRTLANLHCSRERQWSEWHPEKKNEKIELPLQQSNRTAT
jgi:hypothetical protein